MSIKLQKKLSGSKERQDLMDEVSRMNSDDYTTLSVKVPKKLHKEFKGLVGFKGDNIQETVRELLEDYVKDNRV